MTKVIYLECPSGIAGDMCLGALVNLGVPLEYLREELAKLGLSSEYNLTVEKVIKHGQEATKFQVNLTPENHHHEHHHHDHRHLPEIISLITNANLPKKVTEWSINIFNNLAVAEGAVHGISPDQVHFHEVGATDAIVDIVGTCLGLNWLGIEQIYCSPMPTGNGTIKAEHGILPVPVPAVLKLWEMRNVPVYNNNINGELCTPTGVAIVTTLATNFGQFPALKLSKIGLGAGSKDLPIPNILRMWLGELTNNLDSENLETICVLETQIDDCNPQAIAYAMELLLKAGALDVFTQAIVMKKSRQGVLLTVICTEDKIAECETIIFRETTTLGIRRRREKRRILEREITPIETIYGVINVKIAKEKGEIINIQPEYEDCVKIAQKYQLSWLIIHQTVLNTMKTTFN
jgi:pyridinium-3,5-bisthiocarboxylic acid mononucleotide nickel chelatase